MAVVICLLGLMARQVNAARVEVAEDLLVDLRSEDLTPGSVSQWPNRGSLGGVFTAFGSPVVQTVGDWQNVVNLDGASYFAGPVSPSSICGNNPVTIEVWGYNVVSESADISANPYPNELKEEGMVGWGWRSNGRNMGFTWGWKDFGAAAHYGDDYDMAWYPGNSDPFEYPALDTWQYLTYTFDGSVARVYINGELTNEKTMTLNVGEGIKIYVGAQANASGSGEDRAPRAMFTGAIAQVRIHDGVLTPEQIRNNAQVRIQNALQAYKPSPRNGDPDVPLRDIILSWEPGVYSHTHTVYFSEDINAVESGAAQAAWSSDVNWYDPGRLEFGQTYFWRVDEVNAAPDLTVFQGEVWSFTVEPLALPISAKSIVATASSSSGADSGPQKTVDGSGLDDLGLHDTTPANMWMSADNQEAPVWVQYEFDQVYRLHQMWVWNSNNGLESLVGLGVKTATIECSADGDTWTALANVPEFAQAPGTDGYAHDTTVDFSGVAARFVRMTFTGSWGGRSQYGLSEVRFLYIPVLPRAPYPVLGATDVPLDATLSWRAGREADLHRVHFGVDSSAVAEGAALVDTVAAATYRLGVLDLNTTYYWKIDEVNEAVTPSVWEGPVWSFTTKPYLVVEDFDAYTDQAGAEIFATWVDGYEDPANGSQVGYENQPYAERSIVHGGSQSMPLYYGMGSANRSEARRTFDSAQDWTEANVATLTLYVRGEADNVGGQFFVKVNGVAKAVAVDFTAETWQEVNVELASLGVDLTRVTSLALSVEGAASGLVFVDDIRLRP
jgi:hypothetical protein